MNPPPPFDIRLRYIEVRRGPVVRVLFGISHNLYFQIVVVLAHRPGQHHLGRLKGASYRQKLGNGKREVRYRWLAFCSSHIIWKRMKINGCLEHVHSRYFQPVKLGHMTLNQRPNVFKFVNKTSQ